MNKRRIILPGVLLGLCLLPVYLPVQARDGDDWVLVERFQTQLKKAQAGDNQAMYDVGVMYETGRGTTSDPDKAVEWLQRAVDADHHNARARLGGLYYEGKLVSRELGKARALLQKAASAGVPSAQFHLAQMYETGEGVGSDLQQALHWYQQAANGGYYEARARIRTVQAKLEASLAPAPQPAAPPPPKPKQANLLDTLLAGNWQRSNRSAGFLPSTGTKCERPNEQTLRCLSSVQKRDTGYAVISFITHAEITYNGQGNTFDVRYQNTVLNTEASQKQLAPDADPNIKSSVNKGQQTEHLLQCKLESVNSLSCLKDRVTTQTYTNAATN